VRSQIALLEEAAIALKDDCLGFTLARDHDPREIGLLYYVIASSRTLGDGLKRVARYSRITNGFCPMLLGCDHLLVRHRHRIKEGLHRGSCRSTSVPAVAFVQSLIARTTLEFREP
jgi:hypothetical protein